MFSSIFNVKFNGFVVPDSACFLNLFLNYILWFFFQVVEIIAPAPSPRIDASGWKLGPRFMKGCEF